MWRSLRFQARFKYSGGFSRHIVTGQELETFQKQGVVCLRGVFGEWIEKLATGIAKNRANLAKESPPRDQPSRSTSVITSTGVRFPSLGNSYTNLPLGK